MKIATGTDGDKGKVYLDDAVLAGRRVQGVLNVALSDDTQMTNDVNSSSTEHVVVSIRERLRRSDDDGVSGVNTQRVEVLFARSERERCDHND